MELGMEVAPGQIYESVDGRGSTRTLRIITFGSLYARCEEVVDVDGIWQRVKEIARGIKLRSFRPEAKLYRLVGREPVQTTRWGTVISVLVTDVSGLAVAEWRKSYKLSTLDFSKLVGCTQRAVQKWESGQNAVPATLISFLELFETCPEANRVLFARQRGVTLSEEFVCLASLAA